MRSVGLICAAALAMGLASCGGEESDEDRARAAVEESITDYGNPQYRSADDWCDTRIVLTDDFLVRRLSKGLRGEAEEREIDEAVDNTLEQCQAFFDEVNPEDLELGTFEDLEIEVTVQGTAATARVSYTLDGKPTQEAPNHLVKDNDGEWRVSISELP